MDLQLQDHAMQNPKRAGDSLTHEETGSEKEVDLARDSASWWRGEPRTRCRDSQTRTLPWVWVLGGRTSPTLTIGSSSLLLRVTVASQIFP